MRNFLIKLAFLLGLSVVAFGMGQLLGMNQAKASDSSIQDQVVELANKNGLKPSNRIVNAILQASERYDINALELTAIGILESGLGKYARNRVNKNGTVDKGVFQINTVNYGACIEYNLTSIEGNAFCAAKILSSIKSEHSNDYLGRYHSKTNYRKLAYINRVNNILARSELP
jgi:hypothetical protein